MSLLHLIIILSSLILLSTPCTLSSCSDEQQFAIWLCNPIIENIKSFIHKNQDKSSSQEFYGTVRGLCNEVKSCLDPYQCKEAVSASDVLQQGCDLHLFMIQENRDCFRKFLGNIYTSHLSNVSSCVKEFDFLENNNEERYKAYIEGKECFLSFIEDTCSDISQDFYRTRFSNIAKGVSTKPTGQNCLDLPHLMEAEKCLAMYDILKQKTNKNMNEFEVCKEIQKCMRNNCYFDKEPIKRTVDEICDRLSQRA